jgi:hypothetical protein
MTVAYVAIQCTAEGGKVGTFLFEPGTWPFRAVSPIFPDLVALYAWTEANGWREVPYNKAAPCGAYSKES